MEYYINAEMIDEFEQMLRNEEKNFTTIEKYVHDFRMFCFFRGSGLVTKEKAIAYKQKLREAYAISSINSMLAALNPKGFWSIIVRLWPLF